MKNRRTFLTATVMSASIVLIHTSSANAASIAITNASFEAPVQGGPGSFTINVITGWTSSGGTTGVFEPFASQVVPTDGLQTGYLNFGGQISQVLGTTLAANSVYTLTTDFLSRKDCCAWPTAGGELDFMAGSTVLASTIVTGLVGVQTVTVNFTALPSDPNLGQALQIRIRNLDTSSQSQVDVDNLHLDGTIVTTGPPSVPEPGSVLLCVSGLLLAAGAKLRRRRA